MWSEERISASQPRSDLIPHQKESNKSVNLQRVHARSRSEVSPLNESENLYIEKLALAAPKFGMHVQNTCTVRLERVSLIRSIYLDELLGDPRVRVSLVQGFEKLVDVKL